MLVSLTRPQSETDEQRRKKRERELLLLLLFLSSSLDRHARLFISGTISRDVFLFYAMSAIRQSHYQAARIGVLAAGAYTFNAWSVGQRAADAQASFLAAFGTDLANGRYSDGGAVARKARFRLYGLRLTGTANAAWLAALGREEILWVLGGNEDHCYRCPQLAAHGWWRPGTLHQTPGDGQTPCLVRCNCHLETRDGRVSFSNSF